MSSAGKSAEGDDVGASELPDSPRIELERRNLFGALASSRPDTLTQRVAWILNNYPNTRNSDVALQLSYWRTFCPDLYDGGAIQPHDLYKLPRLTSIVRARARVQNTLRLFQADPEVQRKRGTLSDEERDEAADARLSSAPVYAVFIDESGKTQKNLVVGSVWILQGPEAFRIARRLGEWREKSGFRQELHFAEVNERLLPAYKLAIDVVMESASALSMKYVSLERSGTGPVQNTVPKLIYHLLVRGITHEHETGRAPLPRVLQVWKDAEEAGYDQLVLADLRDRLRTAITSQFAGQLALDVMEAVDSRSNDLLQITDLFTAAVNRLLNMSQAERKGDNAKDRLAEYVVEKTGIVVKAEPSEQYEDLAVGISL